MMTVVAFLFVGVQQVSAQYLQPSEALTVLDQELVQIMNAPETIQSASAASVAPSAQLEVVYLAGIASGLKEGDSVQAAIDSNHAEFLTERPNYTAIATQYRNQAIELLEE